MNIASSCCEVGIYTDPGEYAFLYENLPTRHSELCALIKAQFIHPSCIGQFNLPSSHRSEDGLYSTTVQMLGALRERNPAGLVLNRTPDQRLIVSCRHHAVLLASILKHQGVPVRVRVGFAQYVAAPDQPSQHVDHWVCEVWNPQEERWMFVDPDFKKVDFPRAELELAGDVWLRVRSGEINPQQYGCFPRCGLNFIRKNLCHDFEAVLGYEGNYREGPPLFHAPLETLPSAQLVLLDFMAEWLQDRDANADQLAQLRAHRPELKR